MRDGRGLGFYRNELHCTQAGEYCLQGWGFAKRRFAVPPLPGHFAHISRQLEPPIRGDLSLSTIHWWLFSLPEKESLVASESSKISLICLGHIGHVEQWPWVSGTWATALKLVSLLACFECELVCQFPPERKISRGHNLIEWVYHVELEVYGGQQSLVGEISGTSGDKIIWRKFWNWVTN